MKNKLSVAVLLLMFFPAFSAVSAQEKKESIVYVDAAEFPLYGKASDDTDGRYVRLPSCLKDVSRKPVWALGQNSAGLYVRFRSNSTSIHARWSSLNKHTMNHMTDTGTRGLDLYALKDGEWRFVRSARPTDKITETPIIENMLPEDREYMLYLSLYDGVEFLEIGVDSTAYIGRPEVSRPASDRPVVMYGTSILQGGCANRPGMAFTNIIARRLDREVINLGFSGNALLDYEIAELMASVKNPALFVFDYVPNSSAEKIADRGEKFFRIVRDAHPDVPVVFVEDPEFPHSAFDMRIAAEIAAKNAAQKELFEKLKKSGEKNIYYISSKGMIGDDGEATVDGVHFTDLGMVRYVDHVLPVLRKALKKTI